MRKDLGDADAVFDHLRKVDVVPWCPAEVASDPAIREFVRVALSQRERRRHLWQLLRPVGGL